MKMKMTLLVLAITATLPSIALSAITGTTSVQATFTSTIEAGTCNAEIQNASGAPIDILPFGDVFKSDLVSQSRREAFKIAFTNCAGVKNAAIQAMPGAGGSCTGNAYAAGHNVGFEIWKGSVDSGSILNCATVPTSVINLSNGTGNFEMDARIVIANGKTISDVTTGSVNAPVTFTVTYQ
ncbi:fimbrial protein [Enterobacter cloacae]|uniref:fimbrial protein n=1 Tax=Enterobacter cloacae TaxID=550 RepID=UPI000668B56A|nr:fimbrial protein [Enterobacter cloacae]SSH76602.1 Fimbrial protein YadL [Klebsiella pneumoniae]ELG6442109.1 fimbrial protein [Enterobacter cloacae]MCK1073982.1 fimbrial protein [Enterobacter cloacae subsp. cloacae]MCQ9485354.1 fimbrial protein [Enterobacter cloacae]MCQ9529292.1 fimbrial protein [Enterobacter cloacae]